MPFGHEFDHFLKKIILWLNCIDATMLLTEISISLEVINLSDLLVKTAKCV